MARVARKDDIDGHANNDDEILPLYEAAEHVELLARWAEVHRDDLERSPVLARHYRQASHLHRRIVTLSAERLITTTLLDRASMGIVLVDRSGAVLSLNQAARLLSEGKSGLVIAREGLALATPEMTRRLAVAIQSVIGRAPSADTRRSEISLTIPRAGGRQPLHILVAAIAPPDSLAEAEARAAAAIFIGDPDSEVPADADRLGKFFQLTAAETRVALGLANGASVNDLAVKLGLSRNTVRWHVKHVLRKSGVKTQAQFVRLVYRSPAGLA